MSLYVEASQIGAKCDTSAVNDNQGDLQWYQCAKSGFADTWFGISNDKRQTYADALRLCSTVGPKRSDGSHIGKLAVIRDNATDQCLFDVLFHHNTDDNSESDYMLAGHYSQTSSYINGWYWVSNDDAGKFATNTSCPMVYQNWVNPPDSMDRDGIKDPSHGNCMWAVKGKGEFSPYSDYGWKSTCCYGDDGCGRNDLSNNIKYVCMVECCDMDYSCPQCDRSAGSVVRSVFVLLALLSFML